MNRILLKIEVIDVNYQEISVFIPVNPLFVAFVKTFEIVKANTAFIFASTFLDIVYQVWNT